VLPFDCRVETVLGELFLNFHQILYANGGLSEHCTEAVAIRSKIFELGVGVHDG
jgi:hypothetical protein